MPLSIGSPASFSNPDQMPFLGVPEQLRFFEINGSISGALNLYPISIKTTIRSHQDE
jgi:hypothetical protein